MTTYLLAIVPPDEICDVVDSYRKRYARYTNYSIVPHITIYPPFYLDDLPAEDFGKKLGDRLAGFGEINLVFDSVDYFEEKNNVAYFSSNKESRDLLKRLLSAMAGTIKGSVRDKYSGPEYSVASYTPHMTIAEKIPDDRLEQMKEELSSTSKQISFNLSSVCMFEQVEGSKEWSRLVEIGLA